MRYLALGFLLVALGAPFAPGAAGPNDEMLDKIAAHHSGFAPQDIRWSRCVFCHE